MERGEGRGAEGGRKEEGIERVGEWGKGERSE